MQNDRAELIELIKQTPEWEPSMGIPREDVTSTSDEEFTAWPCLAKEALHGLAGEIVRLIEPHTESDPVALLVQFLAGFGNLIGRTAHFIVEQTEHYLKLFAVLVGESSKSRKGTSWEHANKLLRAIDGESSRKSHVMSGLAYGEGLKWAVRDPIEKDEPLKDKGRIAGYQKVILDQGVQDKRLLALEQEFSSVLRVAARDGSTLSATIRDAWDSKNLGTLTKHDRAKATGPRIEYPRAHYERRVAAVSELNRASQRVCKPVSLGLRNTVEVLTRRRQYRICGLWTDPEEIGGCCGVCRQGW